MIKKIAYSPFIKSHYFVKNKCQIKGCKVYSSDYLLLKSAGEDLTTANFCENHIHNDIYYLNEYISNSKNEKNYAYRYKKAISKPLVDKIIKNVEKIGLKIDYTHRNKIYFSHNDQQYLIWFVDKMLKRSVLKFIDNIDENKTLIVTRNYERQRLFEKTLLDFHSFTIMNVVQIKELDNFSLKDLMYNMHK